MRIRVLCLALAAACIPAGADAEVGQFCAERGLTARPVGEVRPKIYDTFIINHETDMLEIRFYETAPYVDYFVVVESAVSTTGHPKRLIFADIRPRFLLFDEKIIHVVLNTSGTGDTTWSREAHVRNALLSDLRGLSVGDAVLVSDADEIFRPDALRAIKDCGGYNGERIQFDMKLYYYRCAAALLRRPPR